VAKRTFRRSFPILEVTKRTFRRPPAVSEGGIFSFRRSSDILGGLFRLIIRWSAVSEPKNCLNFRQNPERWRSKAAPARLKGGKLGEIVETRTMAGWFCSLSLCYWHSLCSKIVCAEPTNFTRAEWGTGIYGYFLEAGTRTNGRIRLQNHIPTLKNPLLLEQVLLAMC